MAQPPKYSRQKDFTVDYGSETDHPALNGELDRAAGSINKIRENLARIQRDDGKLVQGVVTADSVDAAFADELSGNVSSGVQGALDEAKDSAQASTSAASAADSSRIAAANSATSSATSASAAASSASSAALSSGNATTKASDAAASAAGATAAKDAAAASAAAAAGSATTAATAATNADIAASSAATSATNAGNSATSAENSAAAAAASFDDFERRFLGAKAADPATDNDGQALQAGAMYWRTTDQDMRLWSGTAWQTVTPGVPGDGTVTTAKLANGALSADAAGRAKMAGGFLTQAHMGAGMAGNGPAFNVNNVTPQPLTSASVTKLAFTTEETDTGGAFAGGAFTPAVPGYYQINVRAHLVGGSMTKGFVDIYRNGGLYARGNELNFAAGAGVSSMSLLATDVLYLNGTTDTVEVYVLASGTSPACTSVKFSGFLGRAA